MDRLLATLEIVGSALGSLLLVAMHVAIIVALVYWNVREYRNEWRSARRAWWTLKVLVPGSALVIVGGGLFFARGTSGFTGLGVFYGALFLWLFAGPLLSGLVVARSFGVPRGDAFTAALSVLALIVAGWFAGHGAVNSASEVARAFTNFDENQKYKAFKIAADNPAPAGDAVRLKTKRVLRLPDGRRLVHMAFAVEPDLQLYRLHVRVPKQGKRAFWSGTIGHCRSEDTFHVTNVLDQAEWFEVRIAWHRGEPETLVGIEDRIESPPATAEVPLQIRVFSDRIEANIPLPEHYVEYRPVGSTKSYPYVNYARTLGSGAFSNTCLNSPIRIPEQIDSARLSFYSEELYEALHYDFGLSQQ